MRGRASLQVVRGQPVRAKSGRRVSAVGASKYQDVLDEIAGGKRPESQYISTNAELWREPDNAYDPNAVQVLIGGRPVGYLPRSEAGRLAQEMDAAGQHAIACAAEIRGGWRDGGDEGHYGVVVWLPAAAGR
jgi:hypothetical protein